jgi:hypothetical protein
MNDRLTDPNQAIDYIIANSKLYAQARAERIYMEELRKTIKAELCKTALHHGFEAVNAQEREAYSDPNYRKHLLAIKQAVEAEEQLRWMLIAAQARIDCWRTQEASNRTIERLTL